MTCVEKIYIYSGIDLASKEQQEKQLNTSKIKSKNIKEKKSEKEKKKKKTPKMNFSLAFFLDKKHKEENSTALQKANREMEICRGNKPCDL